MPLFSGSDSATARKHLLMVTRIINRYCLPSQYNHEDGKIHLFGYSLKGDAIDWFQNCPKSLFIIYNTSSMLLKINI